VVAVMLAQPWEPGMQYKRWLDRPWTITWNQATNIQRKFVFLDLNSQTAEFWVLERPA
jgi:hypothetical protein